MISQNIERKDFATSNNLFRLRSTMWTVSCTSRFRLLSSLLT